MDKDLLRKKIVFLVEFYYEKFDFLRKDSLDTLKKKALDKYLDSGLTIEEIQIELEKEILNRKRLEEEAPTKVSNEMDVRENHHNIYETLEELAYLLRMANVNYYLEGGLIGYLAYNQESDRVHSNINITIDKKDYDKFKSICSVLGISVVDKGVDMLDKDDEKSNIVMSSFEKFEDGAIKRVSYDEDGNTKETILNPQLAGIVYGDDAVNFKGYKLNILPAEYIYFIKDGSSLGKDKIDVAFLKDKIDLKGLKMIQEFSKLEYVPEKKDNDELSSMMNDTTKENTPDNKSMEMSNGKQKVLEKRDTSNDNKENGYAATSTISGMSILAIAIMVICILVMIMYIR